MPEARLLLAPATQRGWFGGRGLSARGGLHTSGSLADAAGCLDAAFRGESGPACALLGYEGTADVVVFDHAEEPAPSPPPTAFDPAAPLIAGARTDLGDHSFRAAVLDVRQRIAAGDVYVLNLTRRIFGTPICDPSECFAALRARAHADMAALLILPDGRAVASASPERFLRIEQTDAGRTVEVCPIKGTRPRGEGEEDRRLIDELLGDPKERAEHVMVVDLERNDLGRVCRPGSIEVEPLYEVVPTPYCHQMVSTVSGSLRPESTIADVLAATFPCGSVTGAPKIAAMRIAAELEQTPRGAYCGALVVAVAGRIDSSVLIRTLEFDGASTAAWGTGCGITYESRPAAEWLESVLKAAPLLGDPTPASALRETCRVVRGRVPLIDRHLARLAAGGCGPTLLASVRHAVAVSLSTDAMSPRLGVTVAPDGSVDVARGDSPSSLAVDGGPSVAVVEVPLPTLPTGAAKPADRAPWDAAQAQAERAGAEIAILAAPGGTLIDGSTSSLWLRFGRRLVTPPAPPAVAGVCRSAVFDVAPRLGFSAEESLLTADDLDRADEVILTNAYGGCVGVRGRDLGTAARLETAVWEDG